MEVPQVGVEVGTEVLKFVVSVTYAVFPALLGASWIFQTVRDVFRSWSRA